MTLPTTDEPLPLSEAFDRVVKHYGCTPEERELMREAAFRDRKAARVCFAAMVDEINRGVV